MVERRQTPGPTPVTREALDAALEIAFSAHTADEMPKIRCMVYEAVTEAKGVMLEAFPAGDLHAHRAAHEQMMRSAQAEQAFWDELKKDVAKKSIWGILHILLLLLFGTLAVKFGLGAVFGLGK